MYNIFICDDNKDIANDVKSKILSYIPKNIKHLTTYNTAYAFRAELKSKKRPLDIVVMDIDLGDDDGIDLSNEILELYPCAQIIFISGYDRYYPKVYDVDHIYFIKKPISEIDLHLALDKAKAKLKTTKREVFYIKTKKGYTCLCLNTIFYFEKDRRKIVAITSDGKYSFFGKFEDIMDKLNDRFVRCHNSYVVNLNSAKNMAINHFDMVNGVKIPISKTYKDEVSDRFLEYVDDIV